jgi:hypothetical protein
LVAKLCNCLREWKVLKVISADYCIFLQLVAILGSIGLQKHPLSSSGKDVRAVYAFRGVLPVNSLERLNFTRINAIIDIIATT